MPIQLTLDEEIAIRKQAETMMEQLKAVFILAGIEIKSFHQLSNGYCGNPCYAHKPWILVETKYGNIKMGWRKRVISIEWPTALNIHGNDTLPKEEQKTDNSCGTTSWENGVHAWGWGNAVNQISRFVEIAERNIYNKEADARLTPEELTEFKDIHARYTENPSTFSKVDYDRFQDLSRKRNGRN